MENSHNYANEENNYRLIKNIIYVRKKRLVGSCYPEQHISSITEPGPTFEKINFLSTTLYYFMKYYFTKNKYTVGKEKCCFYYFPRICTFFRSKDLPSNSFFIFFYRDGRHCCIIVKKTILFSAIFNRVQNAIFMIELLRR